MTILYIKKQVKIIIEQNHINGIQKNTRAIVYEKALYQIVLSFRENGSCSKPYYLKHEADVTLCLQRTLIKAKSKS